LNVAKEYPRADRVGEQIHRELAQLIHDVVKDPRVGMVTLTDVVVSRDLSHARVYFTVLGDQQTTRASREGLNHAAGFLRGALGQRIKMRSVPELHFIYDDTEEKGARVDALIEEAVKKDSDHKES
jgi:ribosome-binding factor A